VKAGGTRLAGWDTMVLAELMQEAWFGGRQLIDILHTAVDAFGVARSRRGRDHVATGFSSGGTWSMPAVAGREAGRGPAVG